MENKLRGVNLGGWLVLEKWMAPVLFENTRADDEYYLAQDLPKDVYESRIKLHRKEFITEADFLRLASENFNVIRIPIPYFIFGDRPPFVGCIENLDDAFNWAEAYGVQILIDLHSVAYSQNAFDNGGLSGVCKWAQHPEEVDFALSVLTRLSERYGKRQGLWGIEILNEPVTEEMWKTMNPTERYPARDKKMAEGTAPITLEFLYDFYQRAYIEIRKVLPEDKVIVFHDGFQLQVWKSFFTNNQFKNVMLDTHQYVMVAEINGTEQNLDSYLNYLDGLSKEIAEVAEYVRVFVGEWSLFNSYTAGVDTKGGINPTQEEFNASKKLSKEELKKTYRELWKHSVKAWNKGEGHMYWTYKLNIDTINDPSWYGWDSWDLSRCLSHGWIDNNY